MAVSLMFQSIAHMLFCFVSSPYCYYLFYQPYGSLILTLFYILFVLQFIFNIFYVPILLQLRILLTVFLASSFLLSFSLISVSGAANTR